MALTAKDQRDLYSATMERLAAVIGASGKADELVKLTTLIVQAAKKLSQDTPDAMKNKSTATLAEFVMAAKKIAQDTRAVDSVSLQKLSSSRKAVEVLVKELDAWHTSQSSKDDTDLSLDDILIQTSVGSRPGLGQSASRTSLSSQSASRTSLSGLGGTGGTGSKRSSPTEVGLLVSEQEKKLLSELKKQQEELTRKVEPQVTAGCSHGDPEQTLKLAVTGLSRSISQLIDLAGQKAPSKEALLEPAVVLAKMVSLLMELVDTLFVSKFPMRTQVHTFCCMLVDNVVAYGDQSKTEDTASLRLISTQAPALMSALEVMVEQCYKRAQNIKENQQMSLQRNADLHELDSPRNSPSARKRKEPPTPPGKAPPPVVQEFDIMIMICTSVAVDSTTQSLLNKGTEITMKAKPTTKVREIRNLLTKKTSLPIESVQLRFRGDDVLDDDALVTANNPMPYFMFNLHEPGEEELTEFRKVQRRKNRIKIDTNDWSRVPSPVAVAIYDYEALAEPGEEDNLEFEEGDLIEILEQSADGWWTGRVDGNKGVFPASFVELIQKPKTKDERKKLLKRFNQGTLGAGADVIEQDPPPRPPEPKFTTSSSQPPPSEAAHTRASSSNSNGGNNKMFGSSSSSSRQKYSSTGSDTSDTSSPSPTKAPAGFGKFDRRSSEPVLEGKEKEKETKQKKRTSFFKKRGSNPTNSYMPITDDFKRSPILPYKNRNAESNKPVIRELEEEMVGVQPHAAPASVPMPSATPSSVPSPSAGYGSSSSPSVPLGPFKHLHRPKSSPRLANRGVGGVSKATKTTPVSAPPSETKVPPQVPPSPTEASKNSLKRRPPPPPPPYAKTYGTEGLHCLVDRHNSTESDPRKEAESKTLPLPQPLPPEETPPVPVAMTVTPASPEPSPNEEKEEEIDGGDKDGSMEDLLKNLEEFNEFSSTQSLTNGFCKDKPRDYATIPRSELPIQMDEEEEEEEEEELRPASVPAAASSPVVSLEDRACLTPNPMSFHVGTDSTSNVPPPRSMDATPDPPPSTHDVPPPTKPLPSTLDAPPPAKTPPSTLNAPPPTKPPRSRSKRLKMRKMMEEEDKEITPPSSEPEAPPKPAPAPAQPRPQVPHPPHLQKAPSPRPVRPVFHTPKPPPTMPPPPLENGVKQDKPKPKIAGQKPKPPPPVAPPRKNRSLKRPPKKAPPVGSSPPRPPVSAKPKLPPQPATKAHLDVRDAGSVSSNALVSRTASPDDGTGGGTGTGAGKPKSPCSSPGTKHRGERSRTRVAYKTAMKCISYLSSDHLVREEKLISSTKGNSVLINRLLDAIDNSEDIDLNSLQEAPSVLGLLLALYDEKHLGCLVAHGLSEGLCSSMQGADPITLLGGKLEGLDPDHREMLKKLLCLFRKVLKYSDKNLTLVSDIDRVFGPVVFENIPSSQSEPLLAYLISTFDFVIT